MVALRHALLELLVEILAHLVQFVPFLHHLLPLAVPPLVLAALLDQLLAQIPLQELQMTLVGLLLLPLKTKDLLKGIRGECFIARLGCLGYLCALKAKRGLEGGL